MKKKRKWVLYQSFVFYSEIKRQLKVKFQVDF